MLKCTQPLQFKLAYNQSLLYDIHRLATLKHALPMVESLDEGLTDLVDWITRGEKLVGDNRMGSGADIQKYAEDLQVCVSHVDVYVYGLTPEQLIQIMIMINKISLQFGYLKIENPHYTKL